MPENYERPEYKPNADKYKSNADKWHEAVKNQPAKERYGQRIGDTDHPKLPAVAPKPRPQ
jgi:hypothetical protein